MAGNITSRTGGSAILNRFVAEREAARAMERAAARPLPGRGARGPFMAATVDRLTASWLAGRQSINDALRGDLDMLIARSNDMAKNNGHAKRFLKMVDRNIIGPKGVVLQARVVDSPNKPDSLANSAIEAAYFRWCQRGSAEITGRMSFVDVCRVIVRSVAREGAALVREVHGQEAGNPEGFALQLISIMRMDTGRNRAPANGVNAIIMGVEVDDYLRPLAYWIKDRVEGGTAQRYPAQGIHHIFLPEEAEQVRGVPWMHAALLDLHDLGEFNRSALLAARKGADTLGFIVSPNGSGDDASDAVDEDGTPIKISSPGTFDVLPEGYDMRPFESPYPNEMFDPFTKAILRRVSSSLDVAYPALGNDLEGVNFSSIRAGVLEERDAWMQLQGWFLDAVLEPLYQVWFAKAMTAGCIVMPNGSPLPVSKADKFKAHEWQPRRWPWVDPLKDIEAARQSIRSGISSPQMVAAQNGVDVEDVLRDIAAFEAMVKQQGVSVVSYADGAAAQAGGDEQEGEAGASGGRQPKEPAAKSGNALP